MSKKKTRAARPEKWLSLLRDRKYTISIPIIWVSSTYVTDMIGFPYQFFLNLPFGETMAERRNINEDFETPYKFNGKELDPETGLYYYGARYYDPKLSIFMSVDPLAEQTPHVSPYTYCMNNPVNMIDPDGRSATDPSTHTDENGHVVAVYNDGDNGVYKHRGNAQQALSTVKTNYSSNDTSAGGVKMGGSLHSLSFADQSLYNKTGQVEKADIKIDFGSKELTNIVGGIIKANPSLKEYASKAGTGGTWDVKSHVDNGSLLFGKYASPRDAGNFAGGAIAQMSGIEPVVQFGFGAYNMTGNNKPLTGALTVGVGALISINGGLGKTAGYFIGKYGEDTLSQRSIDIGKNYIKRDK